ncbi:WD40 repeat-like protein [Dipodascopsis tothii]|uniref:WD40 repeat-like protein n=1 Tax=Dipodascopsis tothii TaxID=44089 RepID=UPI0034CD0580
MQVPSIDLHKTAEATHALPCTRVAWDPAGPQSTQGEQLLASVGDHLRIWEYDPAGSLRQKFSLDNKGKTEYHSSASAVQATAGGAPKSTATAAPLTSMDWNTTDPSYIITSSIDTTCSIWDLNTCAVKTQLIAHDREVYDVRFVAGSVDVFASVGADGSVRLFDLRALEHSTIVYEPATNPPPLLRISPNARDANVLATFAAESSTVQIIDIRSPGTAAVELAGFSGNVNVAEWSPTQRHVLATGADDCQVLVWDVHSGRADVGLAHAEPAEVNNLTWSRGGDWIGVVSGKSVQAVHL